MSKNESLKAIALEYIINYESTALILKALLNNDPDICSKDSEVKYLTTRITNQISGLRATGIEIETKIVKVPNSKKHYGRYVLEQKENNISKAIFLLEMLEEKLA